MERKYPKTTGHYNYAHILPNKMCYFGKSKQQPCKRWRPSSYKSTVLGPYIEEIGWDNIEHMVIQDGLTKHQAEVIEDWFIRNATKDGFCINKKGSGGRWRDNKNECQRNLYQNNTEYREHCREYNRNRYHNDTEHREAKLKQQREYRELPEVKQHRREKQREYSKTEKRKEYQREYKRNRYQNDPEYRKNQREYHKTEKYKEYRREYMRNYRLKKKEENEKTDYNTMSKIA